ncbi:DNA topology modulation protein FlaR [Saccharopolyspora griseoalba]|uniref:DNA topology modulation protein FlaR n=1 Tax=Saccharopolyspora griseoalba TaxID=1431848 RepID=A0ABW2LPM7_9PSEU
MKMHNTEGNRRRIAVVGSSGAGKSTLARKLGQQLELPVLSLDRYYWQPGWQRPPRQQWRCDQAAMLDAHPSWIADGNYWSTLDLRLHRADTVIVVDLPRRVCLARALRRLLQHRGRAIQAPGCPERWSWGFFSYIWSFPTRHRPRLLAALNEHADHTRIIMLRTRADVRQFLSGHG